MSYILEALRKSERERNLGKVPTLAATTEVARPRSQAHWWLLLAMCVVAGVLGWMWSQNRIVAEPAVDTRRPPDVPASTSTATVAAPEAGRNEPSITAAGAGAQTLDPAQITLNVISWSEDSNRRFAMINQKIYREGDSIAAGSTISSIEPDKVVVVSHGRKVVLHP